MAKRKNDIFSLIEKGLEISFKKLVTDAIRNNEYLVFADTKGNPVKVRGSKLKKYLLK